MSVKFGAITPLSTADEQRQALILRRRRGERQLRSVEGRRAKSLEVAWNLFKAPGLASFNVRELAFRGGYSAGAMYGYFVSRDHILHTLRQPALVDEAAIAFAQVRPPCRTCRSAHAPNRFKIGQWCRAVQTGTAGREQSKLGALFPSNERETRSHHDA